MIDEKKLIEELQIQVERERKKCNDMVEMNLGDLVAKYNHGEFCYVNALHLVQTQPKVGEWIPCSERLPECEKGCETKALMFQIKNSDYIEVGHYGEGGKYRDRYFRTYTDTLEGYDARDVIAWQLLPEPYKEGET